MALAFTFMPVFLIRLNVTGGPAYANACVLPRFRWGRIRPRLPTICPKLPAEIVVSFRNFRPHSSAFVSASNVVEHQMLLVVTSRAVAVAGLLAPDRPKLRAG